MSERFDAIVIGAGSNGLACAARLARRGRRVVVLEARDRVGGAATTSEIAPGYRVSSCAHLLYGSSPRLASELGLEAQGLGFSRERLPTTVLAEDGRHLTLAGDPREQATALAAFSQADAREWPAFRSRLGRFAALVGSLFDAAPPRLAREDGGALIGFAWKLRRLGREDMREFLRVAGMNVADLVEERFEGRLLGAALAFDAVLGTHLGPRSPQTVLTLLYRLALLGDRGLAHPRGGLGAFGEALAGAARAAGADIRTATAVARITVASDRAGGVELASGERLEAPLVVSTADPKRTFLELLGPEHLDTGFVRRVRNLRMRGNAAKVNLALESLPDFRGLAGEALGGRLLVAPSVDDVERAFNPAKYGGFSEAPVMEVTLPSLHDPTLAPEGGHVLSAIAQYAPYALEGGWDGARERFAERVLDTLELYAPGLKARVVAREVLAPPDLEREYGMGGGHWHHGELALDQFLMLRPVPGAARYATPLPGLYLGGAGAHPGGGVTGLPGLNAAERILATE